MANGVTTTIATPEAPSSSNTNHPNPGAHAQEQAYFATNPPPSNLSKHIPLVRSFIAHHTSSNNHPPGQTSHGGGRRVALITSGGTTVPLENQTVRFIDNFSAGTRGATSAEYFLENGYAVIFLHRQFSLLPYSRHYEHSLNCFLDFLTFDESAGGGEEGRVVVQKEYQAQMGEVLKKYRKAKRENLLLVLSFVTVNDYLWLLRSIAKEMRPLCARALFYLAAAVSDFFVPAERMVEHKIQSSEDYHHHHHHHHQHHHHHHHPSSSFADDDTIAPKPPAARMQDKRLIIDLDPVPKFLKSLVETWAPEAMIISFKLETDPALLAEKARGALEKYQHHLVIGNLLNTRKWEVLFVDAEGGERWIRVPVGRRTKSVSGNVKEWEEGKDGEAGGREGKEVQQQQQQQPAIEIESWIVPEVAEMHEALIRKAEGEIVDGNMEQK